MIAIGLSHDLPRFCKINYFFEVSSGPRKGWGKFFHAQWLVHGSKTLLQEASHPRALYWLNECEVSDRYKRKAASATRAKCAEMDEAVQV